VPQYLSCTVTTNAVLSIPSVSPSQCHLNNSAYSTELLFLSLLRIYFIAISVALLSLSYNCLHHSVISDMLCSPFRLYIYYMAPPSPRHCCLKPTFDLLAGEVPAAVGDEEPPGAVTRLAVQLEKGSHPGQAVVVKVLLQGEGDLKNDHCKCWAVIFFQIMTINHRDRSIHIEREPYCALLDKWVSCSIPKS